jgi:hypothetical protein
MPLSPHLRDRILRHLDTLNDEKGYQVLDFAEFVASRYGERQAPSPSIFQRFAEGVEDTMRAGKLSTAAISQTMGLLNQAMGVLGGVAAAGKSVASDLATAATNVAKGATGTASSEPSADHPAAAPAESAEPPKPNAGDGGSAT